jgi:hypothetical protein
MANRNICSSAGIPALIPLSSPQQVTVLIGLYLLRYIIETKRYGNNSNWKVSSSVPSYCQQISWQISIYRYINNYTTDSIIVISWILQLCTRPRTMGTRIHNFAEARLLSVWWSLFRNFKHSGVIGFQKIYLL